MTDKGFLLSYARVSQSQHGGIRGDDIFNLFQQLSTMIQAGMALLDALRLTAAQTQSRKLGEIMSAICARVEGGSTLWAAAAEYPRIFQSHWVQVIRTGEISGQLGPLLESLTRNLKENREARGRLISAMIYPAIIFCVAVMAMVIMLWFVVPTFTQFFKETGSTLPGITRAVISASDFLKHYGIFLVAAVIAAAFGIRHWIRTPAGGRTFTSLLMALPLFGEVLVQASMEKFASNLALLLRAGMPLLEGLYALDGVFEKNVPYRESLAEVKKRVASGGTLASGLAEGQLFTPIMINLVRVGEESGQLPLVLEQVSAYYKQKVTALAQRITAMIEPCIILGMGVAVAVILTAIYLPMFSMGGAVR